jgi:hypothetical protein
VVRCSWAMSLVKPPPKPRPGAGSSGTGGPANVFKSAGAPAPKLAPLNERVRHCYFTAGLTGYVKTVAEPRKAAQFCPCCRVLFQCSVSVRCVPNPKSEAASVTGSLQQCFEHIHGVPNLCSKCTLLSLESLFPMLHTCRVTASPAMAASCC